MTDEREKLLAAFQERREAVTRFLVRRVRNPEIAEDLTQETWIRIATGSVSMEVANPDAYLFRVAANLAADHARVENRRLTANEVEDLLEIPADSPDPSEIATGRQELQVLAKALGDLPSRQREIFRLARIEGMAHREIAEKFDVSTRTVEKDILKALEHCALRLRRSLKGRFGSGQSETS
ncbi:RNA polymerase sigma factor [Lacibacterium aquatile]|uniref:RNA polymerase sigma factor n=1 Tax=Lacibacterium aquatile TaxID=1168082 RepID=A0ABW5E125_9PROT